MKQRILSIFRIILPPLLTAVFLIAALLILHWYSPGLISAPFASPSSPTPGITTAVTTTLSSGDGLKTFETIATSAIHASEVVLGTVKDVFIWLLVIASGSIAYLYRLAKEANDKAIEAVAAAQKAQSAAEMTEKHLLEHYSQLENKFLSLDDAIKARERGEITQEKLIESEMWHSWLKWKHIKDESGWLELKVRKEDGEDLTFAVRIAVESELEEVRKRASITGQQTDDEKEYERRLRFLLRKRRHQV